MTGVARKLTLCWMLAATAHLPFPVWDGDDRGSGDAARTEALDCGSGTHDIDFVRLGCDAPNDPDDGPFDDDPDEGNSALGMFPAYLDFRGTEALGARRTLAHGTDLVHCGWGTAVVADRLAPLGSLGEHVAAGSDGDAGSDGLRGRLLQVMRC
ncbi:MAG: hypothetical protein WD069_15600 [Planctomycetales bacterium]